MPGPGRLNRCCLRFLVVGLILILSMAPCRGSSASATEQHDGDSAVPVALVGNGPSALAASALLSGHWPFYSRPHPHRALHVAIQTELDRVAGVEARPVSEISLLELDLTRPLAAAAAMEGGRSNSPWALLVDALLHPDADGRRGAPGYTCLEIRHLPEKRIEHVVVGRGPGGGSWNNMAPGTVTLSPGYWMELPGLPMHEVTGLSQRALAGRIDRSVVAEYYRAYAAKFLSAAAPKEEGKTARSGVLLDAEVVRVELDSTNASNVAEVGSGSSCVEDGDTATSAGADVWRVSCVTDADAESDAATVRDASATDPGGEATTGVRILRAEAVVLAVGMRDRPKHIDGCLLPEPTGLDRDVAEADAVAVRKTASFGGVSLCLSRACLGKMFVYIYKWLKNAVFRRVLQQQERALR